MTAKPYRIEAHTAEGFAVWTGRRTRTFGTEAAAITAAEELATGILAHSPTAVEVVVKRGPYGEVLARVEVA